MPGGMNVYAFPLPGPHSQFVWSPDVTHPVCDSTHDAPFELLCFPSGQVSQEVAPSSPLVAFPSSQSRQFDAPPLGLYFPAAQNTHSEASELLYFPAEQVLQNLPESAPSPSSTFPSSQSTQLDAPAVGPYFPAAHGLQDVKKVSIVFQKV